MLTVVSGPDIYLTPACRFPPSLRLPSQFSNSGTRACLLLLSSFFSASVSCTARCFAHVWVREISSNVFFHLFPRVEEELDKFVANIRIRFVSSFSYQGRIGWLGRWNLHEEKEASFARGMGNGSVNFRENTSRGIVPPPSSHLHRHYRNGKKERC